MGAGERAAITLALSLHADLILIDERTGTMVALSKGSLLPERWASSALLRGLVDLAEAFTRLKRTNFRYRQEMLDALLDQTREVNSHAARR